MCVNVCMRAHVRQRFFVQGVHKLFNFGCRPCGNHAAQTHRRRQLEVQPGHAKGCPGSVQRLGTGCEQVVMGCGKGRRRRLSSGDLVDRCEKPRHGLLARPQVACGCSRQQRNVNTQDARVNMLFLCPSAKNTDSAELDASGSLRRGRTPTETHYPYRFARNAQGWHSRPQMHVFVEMSVKTGCATTAPLLLCWPC